MTQLRTTPSEENYLEWIYRFSKETPVRPAQIAEKIGVFRSNSSRKRRSNRAVRKVSGRYKPEQELKVGLGYH